MPADQPATGFDLFISYSRPSEEWVETLRQRLADFGLHCFVDKLKLSPGESFPQGLSQALENSRYLVLIVTPHSASSLWVAQEWQAFLATHGPRGRIIPIMLETAELPAILRNAHQIDALHRDAVRVAGQLATVVGKAGALLHGDSRRLYLGQDLVFSVERKDEQLSVTDPAGNTRTVVPPWRQSNEFGVARLSFNGLARKAIEDKDREELFHSATTLGKLLFAILFDGGSVERLRRALIPGQARPLLTILSSDDLLLSLPWELIHYDNEFLVCAGRVDIVRSTPNSVGSNAILPAPSSPFTLVVNVSAPEGAGLAYEEESYRLMLALLGDCRLIPTELGTLEDLVDTVAKTRPTGVHFSGHGLPGGLLFEDDEGQGRQVSVGEMLRDVRAALTDDAPMKFFYLASCHGNDPGAPEAGRPGAESAAARLHREGVTQVVGYYGPISDELSTRAEAALYAAIAGGETTRYAVRLAREALIKAPPVLDARHRPGARDTSDAVRGAPVAATADPVHTHPFAWAQLVLYHRGPDHPLSLPGSGAAERRSDQALQRTFEGIGNRRVLKTGFIGRRLELHRLRRRIRKGDRVFVLQGLGGLGKSTLALHLLPMLVEPENVCTIWCQDAEKHDDVAAAVVQQLLEYCRTRFGVDWEAVVQQVDRLAGDAAEERFAHFLHALLQRTDELALYFDNLESLLIGPAVDPDAPPIDGDFAEWRSEPLAAIWKLVCRLATDSGKLAIVASTRYPNHDLTAGLLPVSPLPRDALFRLMGWFPALRRLAFGNRARLVERLAGHPRAVELANDLVHKALTDWETDHGEWRLAQPAAPEDIDREWATLVEPVLPQVRDQLWDNLLLKAIWETVLGEPERRMLWRMTLLRQPWEWDLVKCLGEPEEPDDTAVATARRLRQTSLLEQGDVSVRSADGSVQPIRHHTLHPATAEFVTSRVPGDPALRTAAHRRIGDTLAAKAAASPYIEDQIEAGYHLFQAGEYDRSGEVLGSASERLQEQGRVCWGLQILTPFLTPQIQVAMIPEVLGRLLGTVGSAHFRLGQAEKAIGFYEHQLVIVQDIGDRYGEGQALGGLGVAYTDLDEVEKAIGFYERQLVISREIGERRGEGTVLGNLGTAYYRLGQLAKAIGFYEQQLVIVRGIEDPIGEGNALGNLGIAYAELGEVEKAIAFYGQQLVIVRRIGDRFAEGRALGNLGAAYARLGELQKAIGFHDQRLAIARETGYKRGEGTALANLGIIYGTLGQAEKAGVRLLEALRIGRETKDSQLAQAATAALEKLRGPGKT